MSAPYRAAPREVEEVFGCRVLRDAKGDEVAHIIFDEDAELIVKALNAHAGLMALHAAVKKMTKAKGRHHTEISYTDLDAAFAKVKDLK